MVKEIDLLNENLPTKKMAGPGGFTSIASQIFIEAVYQSYAIFQRIEDCPTYFVRLA